METHEAGTAAEMEPRGTPLKNDKVEEEAGEGEPRKRDRPAKLDADGTPLRDKEAGGEAGGGGMRKRGRPIKRDADGTPLRDKKAAEKPVDGEKRKRGRPLKLDADGIPLRDKKVAEKPAEGEKRKRGRPPKLDVDGTPLKDKKPAEKAVEGKKPRGRPSKSSKEATSGGKARTTAGRPPGAKNRSIVVHGLKSLRQSSDRKQREAASLSAAEGGDGSEREGTPPHSPARATSSGKSAEGSKGKVGRTPRRDDGGPLLIKATNAASSDKTPGGEEGPGPSSQATGSAAAGSDGIRRSMSPAASEEPLAEKKKAGQQLKAKGKAKMMELDASASEEEPLPAGERIASKAPGGVSPLKGGKVTDSAAEAADPTQDADGTLLRKETALEPAGDADVSMDSVSRAARKSPGRPKKKGRAKMPSRARGL